MDRAQKFLRRRRNRAIALYYYLCGVVGYTVNTARAIMDNCENWQLEEMAVLGFNARHEKPENWKFWRTQF